MRATASGSVTPPDGTFWIGPPHPFDLAEAYLNFRADLVLDQVPPDTTLHLTADSRYRLWVNGAFAGRGVERSWPSSMAVDDRPIAHLLRPGVNRIAIQVYSPGYSHFAYVHRAACGMIGWITAEGAVLLRSDPSWTCQRDPSWSAQVPRVSIYGTGVEDRDLSLDSDWQTAPLQGPAARIVQPPEGPIWASLRPRRTPLPVEETRRLEVPLAVGLATQVVPTDDPHTDLRRILARARFLQRNRDEAFKGFGAEFLKIPPAPGDLRLYIFDLGESRTCLAGAKIIAAGGETLLISYAEKLRGGLPLLSDPETYCRMRPTDRFTLRPGPQGVEGFTPRGARYVIFALDGTATPDFFARLPGYPLAERPLPDLGDATLTAVAQMCRRTTLACLQDGFVDGVWRESSLWLGDAVAQSFALRGISDDPRPHLFALDMAAEGAAADGILPSVLPGDVPAYVITDYNFSWVDLLHATQTHPGIPDATPILRQHWPTLTRLLARFEQDRGPDGLIRSQPGRRLFLDWSAQSRAEPNLTYTLRHLHALRLAADMARTLGHDAPYAALATRLAVTLRATHHSEGWRESPGGEPACQLALALLILTDTVTGPEAEALADSIEAETATPASPFMHHYVFQALARLGRHAAIRRIIAAKWVPWATAGEPTCWENWAIDFPDGSACHGFSAHPLGWLCGMDSRLPAP